jgi:hypothetical protein
MLPDVTLDRVWIRALLGDDNTKYTLTIFPE